MNYIKRTERCIKASAMTKVIKDAGGNAKEIAEYSKWHSLNEGSRIQVTLRIIKLEANGNTAYILEDNLGMLASYPNQDLAEMKTFLVDHGFKPVKDWYLQDCGMTEETWNAWNQSND